VGAADAAGVPIALGGAGGRVMDAPEAFVYDPIETLADGGGIVPRRPVMIWVLLSSPIRSIR